jgi:deltex-like protein
VVGAVAAATSAVVAAMRVTGGAAPPRVPLPLHDRFVASAGGGVDLAAVTRWTPLAPGSWPDGASDPVMLCPLGEDGEEVVQLPCSTAAVPCVFNRSTLEEALKRSPNCPTCKTRYALPGPQPSGDMAVQRIRDGCAGHGRGSLFVQYVFPSGTQGPQHPEPGTPYHGTSRDCFYPDDDVGWRALELLRRAFAAGALFRVGQSATTGRPNTVVWSIHQKTSTTGGATSHGWPDDGYLDRLLSEVASAGVSID